MSALTARLRVESSDLPLTLTVAADETATVQPVAGAGTVPNLEEHLFTVRTADFERFETALAADHTIDGFERVVDDGDEAVYRFTYGPAATVFSAAIAAQNGISLDWTHEGTAWTVRVWLPEREALASLWEYASDNDIAFDLEQVGDYGRGAEGATGLTPDQREAMSLAFEMGYFEEPREVTLEEVAAGLGISQPAASGLLRRGLRRLVVSELADEPAADG